MNQAITQTVTLGLVLVCIVQSAFILVRFRVTPSDVLKEVKGMRVEIASFELQVQDRWTKTDHIKWEKQLQELNPGLKIPATTK